MRIFKAEVISDVDPKRSAVMRCKIEGLQEGHVEVPVYYTTPAGGPLGGGFSAPVDKGSIILACVPENEVAMYYIGTITQGTPQGNPDTYIAGERMTSLGLTTKEGAGVEATMEISESDIRNITRLKGAGGQGQVVINNHPGNESVTVQAQGMNTSIKATGFSNTKPDQIEISAANSVTSRARKGTNYINVGPQGGEIKIHNEGTPYSPLRLSNPMSVFNGDIRIESENNNVVIKSCTDPALVATDSPLGGGISLQAGSIAKPLDPLVEIRVDSQGFVNIIGATGINMQATTGNIEISAPAGQVNIRSGLPTNGVNLQPPQPALPIPPAKR